MEKLSSPIFVAAGRTDRNTAELDKKLNDTENRSLDNRR
jgi:hypothetical protein